MPNESFDESLKKIGEFMENKYGVKPYEIVEEVLRKPEIATISKDRESMNPFTGEYVYDLDHRNKPVMQLSMANRNSNKMTNLNINICKKRKNSLTPNILKHNIHNNKAKKSSRIDIKPKNEKHKSEVFNAHTNDDSV